MVRNRTKSKIFCAKIANDSSSTTTPCITKVAILNSMKEYYKYLFATVGIRDVAEIEKISINKVLYVLAHSNHKIEPKQRHYDKLKVDEFWTYVVNKKNKLWLIYAYHIETGEIVAYVWGKRNTKIAIELRTKLNVSFDTVYKND